MNKYEKIGKAIARYSFLTYDQMIELGLGTQQSNLSPYMTDLIKDKLVYKLHKIGHKAVFYLSFKGARYFGGVGRKQYKKYPAEIQHRLDTVDFDIFLRDHYLSKVSRYFDKKNACRISFANRSLEPDLIAFLDTPKQKELLLFEAERGADIGKIEKKVTLHLDCILNRGVAFSLQFTRAYRVVVQVESESVFERIKKRLLKKPLLKKYKENFLFCWELNMFYNLEGTARKLYYV